MIGAVILATWASLAAFSEGRELTPNAGAFGQVAVPCSTLTNAAQDAGQFQAWLWGQQIFTHEATGPNSARLETGSDQVVVITNQMITPTGFSFTLEEVSNSLAGGADVDGAQITFQLQGTESTCAVTGNFFSTNTSRIARAYLRGLVNMIIDNLQVSYGSTGCTRFPAPTGVCNSESGSSFQPLRQLSNIEPAFSDGDKAPAGLLRPSARAVSNAVANQGDNTDETPNRLTQLFTIFGQFLDHDIGLTPSGEGKFKEEMPIPVPLSEPLFNVTQLKFSRSRWIRNQNSNVTPRQHINICSSLIDGSQIYGNTWFKSIMLRTFQGGKLATSGNGQFMPRDGATTLGSIGTKIGMDPPGFPDGLFAAGDQRANENEVLSSLHTLFVREHNRVTDELARVNPRWNDEQLYQLARRIVIAELQSIVYLEWLPKLLGSFSPSPQQQRRTVSPQLESTFSTAAFRFGHSMITKEMKRLGPGNRAIPGVGDRLTQESFFNPFDIPNIGIDAYIRGAIQTPANALDQLVINQLRNFLFRGVEQQDGIDLFSLNIQRGRDMGLPNFGQVRSYYGGLGPVTWRPGAEQGLRAVYANNFNDIDLFSGLISERPQSDNLLVGQTMARMFREQFERIRDGDKYWFNQLTTDFPELSNYVRATMIQFGFVRLGDIIKRNTDITMLELPFESVFVAPFVVTPPNILVRPDDNSPLVPLIPDDIGLAEFDQLFEQTLQDVTDFMSQQNFGDIGGFGPSPRRRQARGGRRRGGQVPETVISNLEVPEGSTSSDLVAEGRIDVLGQTQQ